MRGIRGVLGSSLVVRNKKDENEKSKTMKKRNCG